MSSGVEAGPFVIDFVPIARQLGPLGERVMILIERQREIWGRAQPTWVVIPLLRDGDVAWLLIADDSEAERRAREVIAAFVGPSVGSLERGRAAGQSKVGLAQLQRPERWHLVALDVVGSRVRLLEALELMTAVRAGEPELLRDVEDPIGFLLRDFHLALSMSDPDASERLLDRLEGTGILAGENVRFLRVERLAKLARWHELSLLPWFGDLARSRRPRHVTEYLLEALWRREFGDAAVLAQPGAALHAFQERDLGSQYRSLLDTIDVPTGTGGRRLVWLAATALGNESRRQRLIEQVDDAERAVLDHFVGTEAAPASRRKGSPLERARSSVDEGDFAGAVELAEEYPDDPALVAVAIRAAFELSDANLAARASALADRVDEGSLPSTLGFVRSLHDVRLLATNLCTGWAPWFGRLASDALWPDAADTCRSLHSGWDTGELRQHSVADAVANDLLAAADGVNALQIRAALDLILDLASEVARAPGASSFTDACLIVLSMQDNPSAEVRNAFFSLTADVLSAAPDAARYADVIRTATVLWERVRSKEAVSWALDVADVLAASPSPDPAARAAFITTIGTGVSNFATRLGPNERALLEALALECGAAVVLPPLREDTASEALEVWAALGGKLVGLYSLLGGVGVRFAQRIRALNPDARVEHNADVTATDALRTLALSADFLIVDTRHAAHAAVNGIDSLRPRDRQLRPPGKGLSSFLSFLRDALERDRATIGANA